MTGPEAPRKDRGSNRGHSRNRARRGHCRSPRRQQVLHLHRPSPIRGDTPSRRHPIRAATARSPRWQGTAFLIANPFAAGVAEATVASDDVPATNTIVATSFVKRLAFWSLRGVSPCDEPYYGPMADQCAIRSEWDASKRQISSVLWNLPGDRPEEVGGPSGHLVSVAIRSARPAARPGRPV